MADLEPLLPVELLEPELSAEGAARRDGTRILVTGSRAFTDGAVVRQALDEALAEFGAPLTVVHGAARGADTLAAEWARATAGVAEEPHPADWSRLGKRAGFVRNARMVALGADLCIAFFAESAANRGTAMCAGLVAEAGIPLRRRWQTERR